MNNFIQTLKNIWKIDELRKRILFTLIVLAVFRFGSYIVMPGVVASQLKAAADNRGANDLLNLINIYTGGAFNNASVFALGIMPYITASIIVQLLGFALPYFQRLQQHEGESGRKKLNQITRVLTVVITLLQGGTYLAYINASNAIDPTVSKSVFYFVNSILLATGTVVAMWLGERITDKGIGNGVSLLIMIGIIARLPQALVFEVTQRFSSGGMFVLILELAALILVVLGAILLVQGVRKIPIQFAKRMVGRTGLPVSGNRDYLPIKLNASGVMPIIFAQAIMFLPGFAAQSLMGTASASAGWVRALNDYTSVLYNVIYFVLVIAFTYVYVALIVNSQQYSEYLKRQNAFVPGVKPGSPTAEFIDTITSKITLPGAVMLAILAITPGLARMFGINNNFAAFFGGSTILILVGVALDTLQQIESHLLMRKYDGLVKSGNIKGRTSGSGLASIGAGS
ncbi:MAG: preprotein translocase subunit SecY [Saprospiraceae bacterium]|nr:preprotein translocase subunit SecY [Saprospiraceae bacterium]